MWKELDIFNFHFFEEVDDQKARFWSLEYVNLVGGGGGISQNFVVR